MALPSSKTAICNLALDLLREGQVSDIDTITADSTEIEGLCSRWYDLARTSLIQAYNWSFATTAEAINKTTTPDLSVYADAYAMPNDFLKLLAIADPNHPLQRYDYTLRSGLILIDNSGGASLNTWFLYDETNVGNFPPLFSTLLAAELALVICHRITAKRTLKEDVKAIADIYRQRALAFNGQQRPPQRFETSKIVNAGLNPAALTQVAGEYEFLFDPN